ncbi:MULTISPECIES: methyltransferase [unclassified Bradyrhizobium]|uniref:methyltransferase n=1 Tax=unclassified Bradyrhizobium TaxID=2631580 RepID=UPI0020B24044|nr:MULTISPECIES: methyltransferase [unclassified Bradyrhizobium]MCP3380581.1 methyltransferase [Bradyrhizobium sp. CCGUVB4N]MCP3441451.1 methyltransferase [Bradyrhizobium sp. CCGUVB14]
MQSSSLTSRDHISEAAAVYPPDISQMIKWRDSSYAADLYIAAVSWLDLFTYLDGHPVTEEELRLHFSLRERPTRTMVRLLESWGLISNQSGRLHATASAVRYLSGNSADNIASYIATMKYKPSVRELYEILRQDGSETWHVERGVTKTWDALMQTDEFADLNTRGMEERGRIFAPHLATLLDCTNDTSLLDVGGGSGVYSAHLLMCNSSLSATIFERPPVDQLARSCLTNRNLYPGRAHVIAGDMFVDPLPRDASLHLYSHVLHNWGPDKVQLLLSKSFDSMTCGGRIAIYSCHPDDRGGRPSPAAEAEYSVLLTTGYEGCCYSFEDMRAMLESTGFQEIDYHKSICNRSLIVAKKIA